MEESFHFYIKLSQFFIAFVVPYSKALLALDSLDQWIEHWSVD